MSEVAPLTVEALLHGMLPYELDDKVFWYATGARKEGSAVHLSINNINAKRALMKILQNNADTLIS